MTQRESKHMDEFASEKFLNFIIIIIIIISIFTLCIWGIGDNKRVKLWI